jgi:acetamidase/formamidase
LCSDVGKPQYGADLNKAFFNTYRNTRQFLIDGFALTEREAISVMSTSVDFGVTQVGTLGKPKIPPVSK